MPWTTSTHSHSSLICTVRIEPLPDVSHEAFVDALRDEVLGAVAVPGPTRVGGVTAQELLTDETDGSGGACLWRIHFNGLHQPHHVRRTAQQMLDEVQDRLESVGRVQEMRVDALQQRWTAD